MSLVDQIANIRALQRQGKSVIEIAAAVGVEIGDVQSILASASMPGSELPRGAVEAVTYSYYPEPHEIVLNDALPEVHIDVPPGFVSIGAIADIALPVGSRVGDAWPVVAIQVNLATPGFTALNTGSVFEASPGDPSLQGPTWTDDGAYLTGWTQVGGRTLRSRPRSHHRDGRIG